MDLKKNELIIYRSKSTVLSKLWRRSITQSFFQNFDCKIREILKLNFIIRKKKKSQNTGEKLQLCWLISSIAFHIFDQINFNQLERVSLNCIVNCIVNYPGRPLLKWSACKILLLKFYSLIDTKNIWLQEKAHNTKSKGSWSQLIHLHWFLGLAEYRYS